jgi:hypothetical protein
LTDEHYRLMLEEKLKNIWNILGYSNSAVTASRIIKNYLTGN